ncbi:MAG: DUF559 domain-containing protein [Gammaproteobacteria bacterium]|nr:DUF559 domain-containing protein [Gammaproteobacteria bacterium]
MERNKNRDHQVTRHLRQEGWRVVRIWEYQLAKNVSRCIARIQRILFH